MWNNHVVFRMGNNHVVFTAPILKGFWQNGCHFVKTILERIYFLFYLKTHLIFDNRLEIRLDTRLDPDVSFLLIGIDSTSVTKLWYSHRWRTSSWDPASPIFGINIFVIVSRLKWSIPSRRRKKLNVSIVTNRLQDLVTFSVTSRLFIWISSISAVKVFLFCVLCLAWGREGGREGERNECFVSNVVVIYLYLL